MIVSSSSKTMLHQEKVYRIHWQDRSGLLSHKVFVICRTPTYNNSYIYGMNGQTKLMDRYFQALFSYKFIFQKQNSLKRQPLFLPRISLTKKPLCISVTVIYLCFFVRDNCFAFLVLRLIKPNGSSQPGDLVVRFAVLLCTYNGKASVHLK